MKACAVPCLAFLTGWPLVSPAQNTHTLPLVRPADFAGQESLVRIVNRSDTSGTVQVNAIDDTGESFGPVPYAWRPTGVEHHFKRLGARQCREGLVCRRRGRGRELAA